MQSAAQEFDAGAKPKCAKSQRHCFCLLKIFMESITIFRMILILFTFNLASSAWADANWSSASGVSSWKILYEKNVKKKSCLWQFQYMSKSCESLRQVEKINELQIRKWIEDSAQECRNEFCPSGEVSIQVANGYNECTSWTRATQNFANPTKRLNPYTKAVYLTVSCR